MDVARSGVRHNERFVLASAGRTGDLLEPAPIKTDLAGQLDDLPLGKDDDTRERLEPDETRRFAPRRFLMGRFRQTARISVIGPWLLIRSPRRRLAPRHAKQRAGENEETENA